MTNWRHSWHFVDDDELMIYTVWYIRKVTKCHGVTKCHCVTKFQHHLFWNQLINFYLEPQKEKKKKEKFPKHPQMNIAELRVMKVYWENCFHFPLMNRTGQKILGQWLAGAGRLGHVCHVWHHVWDVQARITLKARPPDIWAFYKSFRSATDLKLL